jgi:hypothetical protein
VARRFRCAVRKPALGAAWHMACGVSYYFSCVGSCTWVPLLGRLSVLKFFFERMNRNLVTEVDESLTWRELLQDLRKSAVSQEERTLYAHRQAHPAEVDVGWVSERFIDCHDSTRARAGGGAAAR